MRIIKFRGKRIKNGEWLYGDLVQDDRGGYYIFPIDCDGLHTKNKVDTDTIGQFTGLFDKNGKEIYEGDIVKIKSQICGDLFYEVVYSIDEAAFAMKMDGNAVYRYFEEIAEGRMTEVIGNIHDNTELLKGGEK
jgi:uncharacterized phage protein (TIGR01671 family)